MEKIKQFILTVFLGGLTVILPVAILYQVFKWLFGWLTQMIEPLTSLIINATKTNQLISEILAVVSLLLLCFFVGLFVKTTWGKLIQSLTEHWFLERIPGYKTLKELLSNLQPDQERAFSKPVLITLDKSENYFLGFVTDQYDDDRYAVFIPTSPSPVNGFVVQTTRSHIKFVDTPSESMMKTVLSCGVGSSEIMKKIKTEHCAHGTRRLDPAAVYPTKPKPIMAPNARASTSLPFNTRLNFPSDTSIPHLSLESSLKPKGMNGLLGMGRS